MSLMCGSYFTGNGKANASAVAIAFGGEKSIKNSCAQLFLNACACISDANCNLSICLCCTNSQASLVRIFHRITGIADDIAEHLF